MKTLHKIRFISVSLTILLLLVVWLNPSWYENPMPIFWVSILLFGIPHGAIDHLLHFRDNGQGRNVKIKFYCYYLIGMLAVALLWLMQPDLAFLFFLLFSSYHFGDSQMLKLPLRRFFRSLLVLLWGNVLLSAIVTFNYAECISIFSQTGVLRVFDSLSYSVWFNFFLINSFLLSLNLAILLFLRIINIKRIIYEAAVLVGLIGLAIATNAIFTFAVYFAFWHSLPTLIIESKFLEDKIVLSWDFIKKLLPFTLISYVLFLGTLFIFYYNFGSLSVFLPFFVLISSLTLPHLFVMDKVYNTD